MVAQGWAVAFRKYGIDYMRQEDDARIAGAACGLVYFRDALGLAGAATDESRNAARKAQQAPQEVLAGIVERVTFHNDENGFCVLRVKARGHRDLVTVVGHAAAISAGEWITATGEWFNDRTHGLQFKAQVSQDHAAHHGGGHREVSRLRHDPRHRPGLCQEDGEGLRRARSSTSSRPTRSACARSTASAPVRAQRIAAAWAEQKAVREIMVFLHSHGVGTARAVRIYKTYGADAIQVMTENPYRLARDIRGIGFRTADAIAMKLGIEKTAMIRVRAGISYALTEAMDEGHCGLPVEELAPLAVELLEVPKELIQTALDLELAEGTVIADTVGETRCVFLAGLYRSEQAIAERLQTPCRAASCPGRGSIPTRRCHGSSRRRASASRRRQMEAIRLALMAKVLVITGGPGVGKTTIVNSILRILAAKGVNLLLCAPTGRAAKRMTEATGFEAKTIHRLLEVDPKGGGFKRNAENPLDCELLVIDETSMVDVPLMHALLKALPDACRPAHRRRHRPVALRGPRPGAGRHHPVGGRPGRAPDGGVPPGRREPDHHRRAPDQQGPDARSCKARGRERFLLRQRGRPGGSRAADRRPGQEPHPDALRLRPHHATSRCSAP